MDRTKLENQYAALRASVIEQIAAEVCAAGGAIRTNIHNAVYDGNEWAEYHISELTINAKGEPLARIDNGEEEYVDTLDTFSADELYDIATQL